MHFDFVEKQQIAWVIYNSIKNFLWNEQKIVIGNDECVMIHC